MLKEISAKFASKTYSTYFVVAVLLSLAVYSIFQNFLVKNGGVWTAPLFVPIQFYPLIICAINIILSLLVEKKDKNLAIAFNFTTISVNFLLIIAFLLNYRNPNG